MFSEISINNLRSIEKIELLDLRRLNILVGPNNCGKTTILEGLFLILGMSNPQLSININNFRELLITENHDLNFNFRNFEFNNTIKITANDTQDGIRKLEITPKFSDNIVRVVNKQNNLNEASDTDSTGSDSDIGKEAIGLNLKFSKKNGSRREFLSRIFVDQNKLNVQIDNKYKEALKARFFNNHTLYTNLPNRIDLIQKEKKKKELINFLKIVDEKVTDIALSHTGLVYVDIGIKEMVPINLMGDGFKKVCAVIANLLVMEDGFLIIDEIENGLHFTTLSMLWKAILEYSRKLNVQIFLATHSYEAIKVLLNVLNEGEYDSDILRLYSIQKDAHGVHKSYKYEYDNLQASIQSDIEIRGKFLN